MTNHVHLLLTPASAVGPARLMNRLGRRYVRRINDLYSRTGTLCEGRYRSCLAGDDGYVLACYRYIELNPVRARMIDDPAGYQWSSHRQNSGGAPAGFLVAHPSYEVLGSDRDQRAAAYREMFSAGDADEAIARIRTATASNAALGSARFQKQIEAKLGRRVVPLPRGRPRMVPSK